jgi:hypothetical protein
MTTKRRPIRRPPRGDRFSPAALAAFGKMLVLEQRCTCAPVDWKGAYWEHEECRACRAWSVQDHILCRELRLKPWQVPAVESPDAVCFYPAGSAAAAHCKPKLEAQARYRALMAALDASRKSGA